MLLVQILSLGAVLQFQSAGPNSIEFDLAAQATLAGDDTGINASVYAINWLPSLPANFARAPA